jgi:hypothetical protein
MILNLNFKLNFYVECKHEIFRISLHLQLVKINHATYFSPLLQIPLSKMRILYLI